jgi:hypothetical protein
MNDFVRLIVPPVAEPRASRSVLPDDLYLDELFGGP